MIYTARAPVVMGDKLFFYYGGFDGLHDERTLRGAIGLAVLRADGFCSMSAGEGEGWLITRREPFREPVVTINGRTAKAGSISAEMVDRHNRVLAGFSREDCVPFEGDSIAHTLRWKASRLPADPKAEDYKLRFWLKQAELFSYLPSGLDPAQPDLARVPAK